MPDNGPESVLCSFCFAKAGAPCTDSMGEIRYPHHTRHAAWLENRKFKTPLRPSRPNLFNWFARICKRNWL